MIAQTDACHKAKSPDRQIITYLANAKPELCSTAVDNPTINTIISVDHKEWGAKMGRSTMMTAWRTRGGMMRMRKETRLP